MGIILLEVDNTSLIDGYSISLSECASEGMLTISYYDDSWNIEDAIEDALSGF